MIAKFGLRGLLAGRPGRQVFAAAFVTALLVVAACIYVWIDLGGGAMYGPANVKAAESHPSNRLRLILDSCYEFIRTPRLELTPGGEVKVEVVAFSTYPRKVGCRDYVDVHTRNPLGDRMVIDGHTGQSVSVRTVR